MQRLLLANEERLARIRARWARQNAERKDERAQAANLIPKPTTGTTTEHRERFITPHQMAICEAYFWGKRGIILDHRLNSLSAPVRDRTTRLATALGAGITLEDTQTKKGDGSNASSEAPSGERAKRDNPCAGTPAVTVKDRWGDADDRTSVATLNPATQTVAPSAVPA